MLRDVKTIGWAMLVAVATAASAVTSARAEIIYSGSADGPWQSGAASARLAQTFSTGTSPMTLDSVQVWVRNANSTNSSSTPGNLTLELFATDGSNKPTGSSLLTIVNSQSIGSFGDGWVSGTGLGYSLASNTTYAVAFLGSAGSTISWKYNDSNAIASSISPTPTFYDWQSPDNGGTWSTASPTTGFNMVVNATAVPEPATAGLVATAAGVAGGFLRFRRRSSRKRSA